MVLVKASLETQLQRVYLAFIAALQLWGHLEGSGQLHDAATVRTSILILGLRIVGIAHIVRCPVVGVGWWIVCFFKGSGRCLDPLGQI